MAGKFQKLEEKMAAVPVLSLGEDGRMVVDIKDLDADVDDTGEGARHAPICRLDYEVGVGLGRVELDLLRCQYLTYMAIYRSII